MIKIMAIDPGNIHSAYVILDEDFKLYAAGKVLNNEMLQIIKDEKIDEFAIEMIAAMGMTVGESIFETIFWIGRFWELSNAPKKLKIYRREEKTHLCGTMKAKDGNIRQVLLDRFGPVGIKKNPGYFYGFKADMWAAMAVATVYIDVHIKGVR